VKLTKTNLFSFTSNKRIRPREGSASPANVNAVPATKYVFPPSPNVQLINEHGFSLSISAYESKTAKKKKRNEQMNETNKKKVNVTFEGLGVDEAQETKVFLNAGLVDLVANCRNGKVVERVLLEMSNSTRHFTQRHTANVQFLNFIDCSNGQ
jgi:hypothetical protein